MSHTVSRRSQTVIACLAMGAAAAFLSAAQAHAEDATKSAEATYKDVQQSMGSVPTFMKLFPKAGVAGAWAEVRDIEFSDKTALSPKVKSLISLAVAAQIPCQYCIWSDTKMARQQGATDEEIAEAVAMSALTRHWSTFFNGMQIDFDTYKKEMGGDLAAK